MNRVVDCRASRGLSMVELLVALALGLIITAAVLQMFLASKTTYRMQEALARIQENGRFAIGQLANDIRMAGYMGCSNVGRIPVNVIAKPLANPPENYEFTSESIIIGHDNVASGNSWSAVVGSDVLEIRRGATTGVRVVDTDANNANIKIEDNSPGFVSGDVLFVTDCSSADVFRATNVSNGNNGRVTIAHAANMNTPSPPRLSKVYGSDAEVMAFETVTFFVRNTSRTTQSGTAIPVLFVSSRAAGSSGAVSTYELVEGVENMQLEYGVDTDGDRAANRYLSANDVSDWARVVSVRVSLLMASTEEKVAPTSGAGAQALTYNDSSVTADGRLRQVFGTVVTIRNRAP